VFRRRRSGGSFGVGSEGTGLGLRSCRVLANAATYVGRVCQTRSCERGYLPSIPAGRDFLAKVATTAVDPTARGGKLRLRWRRYPEAI
jgi:hypothetical protein